MGAMNPGLPCISETIHIQGSNSAEGRPCTCQTAKKIPQVYPVQLNKEGELQSGTITSLLQTIKPSQTASVLSIPHPYRKYGHNNDPLELKRKLPDSIVHLGTKISEQLGTLLYG